MSEDAPPGDGSSSRAEPGPGEQPPPEIEARVDELADAFLEEAQAGLEPDSGAMAARHPELAPWLERRLKLIEMMRVVGRSTVSPPRVHCPHCGNPALLAERASHATCSSCGSIFRVERRGGGTSSRDRQPERIGRFQVLSLLGRGAFGAVYKAFDPELSRVVAVKVPRAGVFASAQDEDRFLREARHAAQLRHPSIVEVHEVGFEEGLPFIVSSFIEGETLAQRMVRDRPGRKEAARIVERVAMALDHAHGNRIVHRDVKPQNILLDRDGDPHITDFGLAHRDEGEVTVTLDGQILGTPAYMSPEQASGDHSRIDSRTDVYSLGVVLYELLSGELPFKGSPSRLLQQVLHEEPRAPRALNDHIPRDLETICLKSMSKHPGRRYATAGDMARDIARFLAGEPIAARPVGRPERVWRWSLRNRLAASVAVAIPILLLAAALAAGFTALQIARARDEAKVRLSKFSIANGFRLMSEGDSFGALSWFVEASRIDREDFRRLDADRTRLETTLQHVPKLTGAWFFDRPVLQALFAPDGSRIVLVSGGRVWFLDLATGERRALPTPEDEEERRVEISPDGRKILSSAENGAVRAWDASGAGGGLIVRHGKRALRSKFTPDGKRFITASADGSCRIWETDGQQPIATLEYGTAIRLVSFFPDGRRVLIGGSDGSVASWDYEAARKTPWVPGHSSTVLSTAFSQDGARVLTTSDDRTAKIWDASTGKLIGELTGHGNQVLFGDLSPDGARALTASLDGYARVWDVESRAQTMTPLLHITGVATAVFTSGGRRILTACFDGSARFWDATSGKPLGNVLYHPGGIFDAMLSPEGRRVFTFSKDGVAKLWDLAGEERMEAEIPTGGWVSASQLSPDGSRLLVGRLDGDAQVWDVASGAAVLPEPVRHEKAIRAVAFAADGSRFATGSEDGTARVWDLAAGKALSTLVQESAVRSLAFSPTGDRLATGGRDGSAILWDPQLGARTGTAMVHRGPVRQVRFSPDGRLCATASDDRTARIWDGRSGAPLTPPLEHEGKVAAVIFSPDGERVATATDEDGAARVWRARTGEPLTPPFVRSWDLRDIAFSPDGRSLLVATSDTAARIWNAATGEPLTPEMKHRSGILHAEFSPDGSRVITAGYDRMAIVWDAASGEPLAPPMEHASPVQYVAFSRGNDLVVTVPGAGPAQVRSLPPSTRPVEDAILIAGMLCGRRVDAAGGLQALQPEEFRRAWEVLRPKYPPLFTAAADEVIAWHRREARECMERRLHAALLPHLEVLARAQPADADLELQRGNALAELDRTHEALDGFTRALELRPDDSRIWLYRTAALLKLGDLEAARSSALSLKERLGGSNDIIDVSRAIWVSCLHPSFATDKAKLVEMARGLVDRSPGSRKHRHTLAMVLFRAGLLDEALREIEECIRGNDVYPQFWNWIVLGMVEAGRGRFEEARRWVAKVREDSREHYSRPDALQQPPDWFDRFQLKLLLDEAEAAARGEKDTP